MNTPQTTSELGLEALHIFWQQTLHGASPGGPMPWDLQCTLLAGLGLNK